MSEAAGTCTSRLTPWHILLKKEPPLLPRRFALESFVVVVVVRDSAKQQSGAGH
jgi:hypothetical protein